MIHLNIQMSLIIASSLVMAMLISSVDSSFCGPSGVPFSFEVLPSGAPVLGCAQPSCVAAPETTNGTVASFLTNADGQADGFLRTGDEKQIDGERFVNKLIANCSGKFSDLSCPRRDQWVGGIEYIDHPRQPLILQCCTFAGLRFSQEVGVTNVGPGEAITGGEVIREGRQISFDVIANARKVVDANTHVVSYEVTVRRMNCLPDPPEPVVEFEKGVNEEIVKVLSKAIDRDSVKKLKKLEFDESQQVVVAPAQKQNEKKLKKKSSTELGQKSKSVSKQNRTLPETKGNAPIGSQVNQANLGAEAKQQTGNQAVIIGKFANYVGGEQDRVPGPGPQPENHDRGVGQVQGQQKAEEPTTKTGTPEPDQPVVFGVQQVVTPPAHRNPPQLAQLPAQQGGQFGPTGQEQAGQFGLVGPPQQNVQFGVAGQEVMSGVNPLPIGIQQPASGLVPNFRAPNQPVQTNVQQGNNANQFPNIQPSYNGQFGVAPNLQSPPSAQSSGCMQHCGSPNCCQHRFDLPMHTLPPLTFPPHTFVTLPPHTFGTLPPHSFPALPPVPTYPIAGAAPHPLAFGAPVHGRSTQPEVGSNAGNTVNPYSYLTLPTVTFAPIPSFDELMRRFAPGSIASPTVAPIAFTPPPPMVTLPPSTN